MRVKIVRSNGMCWYKDMIGQVFEVRRTKLEDVWRENLDGVEYTVHTEDLINHGILLKGNYFIADEDIQHKSKMNITVKRNRIRVTICELE